MSTPARRAAPCALALALLVAPGAPGQAPPVPEPAEPGVERRGGPVIRAPVVEATWEGVRVGGAAPRLIPWDRVKAVSGERAGEADAFIREIGEPAWRARTRLERGDFVMAEPLFESLFEKQRGRAGPTAAVVAAGLLRCRLERGAQSLAVEPWLAWLRLSAAGDAEDDAIASPVDPEWLLAPALAPIWLPDPGAGALADSLAGLSTEGLTPAAGALAWWYAESARLAAGLPASPKGARPEPIDHPGVALVEAVVLSRAGPESERKRARESLAAGLERDRGLWREAWRRSAIGMSMLREADERTRLLGEVEALHVPARFAASQPHLAGLVLAEVARARAARGRNADALILRAQIERIDPDHPALRRLDAPRAGARPQREESR